VLRIRITLMRIPDPDASFHFDTDPDPTFHFDVDPDPTFHFDADQDLISHFVRMRIRIRNLHPHPAFHF
jgi:hypothetical protein